MAAYVRFISDNYYTRKRLVTKIQNYQPFCKHFYKIKAWLDLTYRKNNGETIDSKNMKKHKNDVFRLYPIFRIHP